MPVEYTEASPEIRAVYDDIKARKKHDNLPLLYKNVMAGLVPAIHVLLN